MKKVGLRTIKTLISIFMCLMIYVLIKAVCKIADADKDYAFLWFNPFFASIAAAYSIYPNKKKSLEQAKNRIVASIIGGLVAIILVVTFEFISINLFNSNGWPTSVDKIENLIIPYILVSLTSIVVVFIGVTLKQQGAIFVSILTFLSITINANSTIARQIGEWGFGFNRIMSTVIGVLVALAVNSFRLPHRTKNDDLLFAIGMDGILNADSDRFKGFISYKLNALDYDNIKTTLFTTRTPVTFMHLLEDVSISQPVVCMSGAALFDVKKHKYLATLEIPYDISVEVDKYLDEINVTPFKNYIIDDVLNIHCDHIDNEGERLYMESKKNAAYCNCTLGNNSRVEGKDVLFYLIVEEASVADKIVDKINNTHLRDELCIQIYDVFENKVENSRYIKIYNKKILELNILKEYCNNNDLRLVGLSATKLTKHLLDNSDIAVASYEYKDKDTIYAASYDQMFKKISRVYYSKKYQKEN